MHFPLAAPDEDAVEAMRKSWQRQDLTRYLQRWSAASVPQPSQAFWDYPWRGLDVGCGFGKYVIDQTEKHAERAYLGVDKGYLRGGGMIKRVAGSGRANLFGVHANVIPVIAAMPDASLDQITVFYPNPWWPKKHYKKRWPYHPVAPKMIRALKPGGVIILTSNEAFYLGEWQFALENHPEISGMTPSYAGPIRAQEGRTHFEIKFIEEGVACGEIEYRKDG